jgi:hypothetical protein
VGRLPAVTLRYTAGYALVAPAGRVCKMVSNNYQVNKIFLILTYLYLTRYIFMLFKNLLIKLHLAFLSSILCRLFA